MRLSKNKTSQKPSKSKKNRVKKVSLPKICSNIEVVINGDDPSYIPVLNKDGSCELSVNFKVSPCIGRITTVVSNDKILLGHRMVALIDCGISVQVPEGYQISGFIKREFSQKGLILMTDKIVDENGRVKIIVCNIGHESVEIKHGDKIAQIELIQTNKFKWKLS